MSPDKTTVNNPCASAWQKKWLRLECHCPEIQNLADVVEKFCGRWFRNDTNQSLLVLAGENGCGKTHVASSIIRFAYAAGLKALDAGGWNAGGRVPMASFAYWPEIADAFKAGEYGSLEEMKDCDLLILDDLGAEHDPSKNATDKLCQILSRRERKFTVVTMNIKPEEWPEKFDTRVADRMIRNSQVVNLFGISSYSMRTL